MTRVNLLPWRENLRKERVRQFKMVALSSAVLMGVIVFYVHIHINGVIEYQNTRNAFITAEIAKVDETIKEIRELETKKQDLLNRMNVIQELQTRRPLSVRLVDELVKVLPEGVYLSSMTQTDMKLVFNGYAQSNARVSRFMRNLDKSIRFADPKLDVIYTATVNGTRVSNFVLRVTQRTSEEVKEAIKEKAGEK